MTCIPEVTGAAPRNIAPLQELSFIGKMMGSLARLRIHMG